MAAGGLAYEISLTRLLSALLVSSWVGPVLTVALAGVGFGAALAAAAARFRTLGAARTAGGSAALLAVLALPVWLWAVGSGRPLWGLALPLLAFTGLGLASAAVLSWWPARAASLLRADYGAAAVAALVTPWLLGQFGLGALGAALVAAAAMAGAALALTGREGAGAQTAASPMPPTQPRPRASGLVALAATTAGIAAVLLGFLAVAVGDLRVEPGQHMGAKPIIQSLGRGGVVGTSRWDATARTDLVRLPNGARYLYMDGGAGSLIPTPDPRNWSGDVGAFPFAMAPAESAFLIGTGGGLDVAQARANGVDHVVAVEVNPASVALVRELGATAGLVYEDPTEVVIGDGRRVLAAGEETYDVITLANVVTGAAELRGAALTENRVYTVEAFEEYLAHLTPDGRLALKLYDEVTLTRALTTALAALLRAGHAEDAAAASRHLMAVLDVSSGTPVPLLVVRRTAFDTAEAVAAARVAERRGWPLLLVPGLLVPPALQPLVEGESTLEEIVESTADVDVSPTHDDAPYFFSFEPGVPRDVQRAGLVAALVMLGLLVLAVLAGRRVATRARPTSVPTVTADPGSAPAASSEPRIAGTRSLVAAALLGAGFLLVELGALPVVQGAAGHPAWSLSMTLGAVLLGSALGAQLAARRPSLDSRTPALLAGVAVLIWSLVAPLLSSALIALAPTPAGLVLAASLFIVAVPMGLPFPRLLAAIRTPAGVATALALSGTAAVAAGAGALWLSHALGLPWVLWMAALTYLLAAAAASVVTPPTQAAASWNDD